MKEMSQPLVPGTVWSAVNGPGWIYARIKELRVEGSNTRVYFTVDHRPNETLNCYAEAFVSRYRYQPE